MPEITAIIVNYNAGGMLLESVRSLLFEACVCKVIIIDNNSKDNSMDTVEQLAEEGSRIVCIRNSENLGFAKACNMAIPMVKSEYMLFFNPDCIAGQGVLGRMMNYMENNPDVAMAGPCLLNSDGSEQAGGRRAVPTPWRAFVRVFHLSWMGKYYPHRFKDFLLHQQALPDCPIEVEAISGSCMLVNCKAVNDIGAIDEHYFMHCEDLDWCMRFRQKGWKICFIPDAKAVHHKGSCSKSRPIFVEWHKHKGMVRFYRKFFRHQYPPVLMWIVISGIWLRFGLVAIHHAVKYVRSELGHGG